MIEALTFGLLLIIVAVAYYALTSKPSDPQAKLTRIIEDESAKLAKAQQALFQSEQHIRQIERARQLIEADITEIKRRIKTALAAEQEVQAKTLTQELLGKERELATRDNELQEALEEHKRGIQVVNQYRENITALRHDAEGLTIKRGLAEAAKDQANFKVGVKTGIDTDGVAAVKSSIEDGIIQLQAEAAANHRLAGEAEDFVGGSVDARLNQLKSEP